MKTATLQHKAFSADVKISADEARTVRAVISSSAVDRSGDVLVPMGMNSKDFEANPVVLLMHSSWSLPIGKVTALKRGEETVEAKIQFAERPEGHPQGQEWVPETVFSLFKQGVLNAFSVGLVPTDSRAATSRDVTKYGEDCIQVVNRWKLIELSVVPLPCNQEAVATAVSKGFVTQESVDRLLKNVENGVPETAACRKCMKEYPLADLSPVNDDDGGYECDECMDDTGDDDEKAAAPATPVIEAPAEAKAAPRRVVTGVDMPQTAPPKAKRVVVHMIDAPDGPGEDEIVMKAAKAALQKRQGRIYLLE